MNTNGTLQKVFIVENWKVFIIYRGLLTAEIDQGDRHTCSLRKVFLYSNKILIELAKFYIEC